MHIANATIALIVSPPPLCVAHAHVRHTNGCIRDTRSTARWKTTDGAGIAHALHTPSYPSSLLVLRVFVRTCTYVRARVCVTRSRKTLSGQFRLPPFFPFLTPWRVSLVRVCTPGNATKVLWRIEKEREREREIVASKSGKSIFIYGAVCSECLFIRSFIKDRLPLLSSSLGYFSFCRSLDRFAPSEQYRDFVQIASACARRQEAETEDCSSSTDDSALYDRRLLAINF